MQFMKIFYYLLFASWYLLSLLPLKILYVISDMLYYPVYHCIRYRRDIVRKNLRSAYPSKDITEIIKIEKRFYHFFCDYVVETLKLFSISKENLKKRMTFGSIDKIIEDMQSGDQNFCFVYLGHFGNWEWIASLPYWVPENVLCGQIYHPLRNHAFNSLFLKMRNQFGGESIPMKTTLRRIVEMKRAKQKAIIGFISDQLPKWNSIHHFSKFMRHETAVFIGTEQIGKQVDAIFYYADVSRPHRGYYHCEFKKMTSSPKSFENFKLTDIYMHNLELMINDAPHLWLWSHDRWKRTKEEWLRRQKEEEQA